MLRACFSQHFQGAGSLWKCPEKVTAGEHPSSTAGEKVATIPMTCVYV
ncbi:Membrane-bound lytic murein transglycosylase B [Pseudomonas syringae pv. actinidiae]|uniref:Membrane-bound lytic murein transglycosylase B n=1 Tax=Pseudomonas syringae pv. actinidiae TaxID=103796 RepID=A0A2V0QC14_PSESF|nr:Membrane-bound lytic murein transglycosylase B [Pseudomonas syringae pv. actinidiae]